MQLTSPWTGVIRPWPTSYRSNRLTSKLDVSTMTAFSSIACLVSVSTSVDRLPFRPCSLAISLSTRLSAVWLIFPIVPLFVAGLLLEVMQVLWFPRQVSFNR